jgi:rod shape-determining protein MreD
LLATALVVFMECWWGFPRRWLGGQVDLLPVIVLYVGLKRSLVCLFLVVLWGGLWYDSLSDNPMGTSVLSLIAPGFLAHKHREFLMRDDPWVQFALGGIACLLCPGITLLQLTSAGRSPLVGWGTVWVFVLMGVGGALVTPLVFRILDRLNQFFSYPVAPSLSFRKDREIKRGRH